MNHRTSLPKIMKTVPLTNTVKQSPLLCSFFLIPLILACFALSPTIQAGQIVLNPSSVIGGSGCYPGWLGTLQETNSTPSKSLTTKMRPAQLMKRSAMVTGWAKMSISKSISLSI